MSPSETMPPPSPILIALGKEEQAITATAENFDRFFTLIETMRADTSFKDRQLEDIGRLLNDTKPKKYTDKECLQMRKKLNPLYCRLAQSCHRDFLPIRLAERMLAPASEEANGLHGRN